MPWVSEEDEHVALVLHLLHSPVTFGVDALDDLDCELLACAAQHTEAHLAEGTLAQLVLDFKVARPDQLLPRLGRSGRRAGRARHALGPGREGRAPPNEFVFVPPRTYTYEDEYEFHSASEPQVSR